MSVFGVPRNPPPLSLSFESIVMENRAYTMGSFDAYVDTSRDYAAWFAESSTMPIIGDVPVSGGRVLGGLVRAQVASGAEWRLHAEALQAKVTELKTAATAREVHMQEETVRERELWQRDREARTTVTEREREGMEPASG